MITEGLSDSKLKWGYWYITHKLFLRQISVYILIFINLNLWLFAAFFVFKVYFFDNAPHVFAVNKFVNSKVNYSTFNQINQPKQLRLGSIDVLQTGSGKYDLLVLVTNPNINWVGRVSGSFIVNPGDEESDGEYEEKIVSILGGEAKYIIEAGVEAEGGISAPQFKINYIQWQRIRNQNDFGRFVNERSNFEVTNIKYQTSTELQLGTQISVSGLSFEIENNSLYDYWTVNNKVLFKRGGKVVAVYIFPLEEFKIGQHRLVDFRMFDNLIGISSVEVKPDIDIFDEMNVIEEPFMEGYLK
jgi:hypothetical protein